MLFSKDLSSVLGISMNNRLENWRIRLRCYPKIYRTETKNIRNWQVFPLLPLLSNMKKNKTTKKRNWGGAEGEVLTST